MTGVNIPLGILQRMSEFLADLPEDQLSALAEGRARIAYVPEDSPVPAPRKATPARSAARTPAAPSRETLEQVERLESLSTREQAASELTGLSKPKLQEIAKALSVPGVSKLNLADLRAEIVQATVGRRLDSIAIRGFEGERP